MTKYMVVLNPRSGRGRGQKSIKEIESTLQNLAITYDLVLTEHSGHGIELASQAVRDGYDVVVAAGGDGTANECINGIIHACEQGYKAPALALISIGNGNDLAYSVGTPIGNITSACRTLVQDQRRKVDVGVLMTNDLPACRYFLNGVGIGFDAAVNIIAAQQVHFHGFISYAIAAFKTIFLYYKAPFVSLEYADGKYEQNSLMVSVMNGRRLGGGFYMAPNAHMEDGMLDLCIADEAGKAEIIYLVSKFMRGTQIGYPKIHPALVRSIHVKALHGSLPVHADGEMISSAAQEIEIHLYENQFEFIVEPEKMIA